MRGFVCVGLMFLGIGTVLGCGPRPQESFVASSASQAVYAVRFPDTLESTRNDFNQQEQEANAVLSEVSSYPRALEQPKWQQVLEIVDAALTAGQSQAYSDQMHEVRHVRTFFEQEKDELSRRAGGAAQYAAQQGGCTVQVGGAVGMALHKAVDKQLETRLQERNEAHLLVHRYSASMGDKNAARLSEQVDRLSYLSFLVHIGIPETKRQIDAMLAEAEQIEKTADDFIAKETSYQQEAGRTDKEKEASVGRVKLMQETKAKIASKVEASRTAAQQMTERMERLRKTYEERVEALRNDIRQRGAK
ncbi:MAG TPA: hypothetical protein PLV85_08275 [Polyangiaceae bacterium]|nr:hypothetical protein [Polyangiaceae bacterium]